jgi:hypothetical protein
MSLNPDKENDKNVGTAPNLVPANSPGKRTTPLLSPLTGSPERREVMMMTGRRRAGKR